MAIAQPAPQPSSPLVITLILGDLKGRSARGGQPTDGRPFVEADIAGILSGDPVACGAAREVVRDIARSNGYLSD